MGGWHTYSHTGLPLKSIYVLGTECVTFLSTGERHRACLTLLVHIFTCDINFFSSKFNNACMVHVYKIVLYWYFILGEIVVLVLLTLDLL